MKPCCVLAQADLKSANDILKFGNEISPNWIHNQTRAMIAETHLEYCAAQNKEDAQIMTSKALIPVGEEDQMATPEQLEILFDHYKRSTANGGNAWFTMDQMARVFKAALHAWEQKPDAR